MVVQTKRSPFNLRSMCKLALATSGASSLAVHSDDLQSAQLSKKAKYLRGSVLPYTKDMSNTDRSVDLKTIGPLVSNEEAFYGLFSEEDIQLPSERLGDDALESGSTQNGEYEDSAKGASIQALIEMVKQTLLPAIMLFTLVYRTNRSTKHLVVNESIPKQEHLTFSSLFDMDVFMKLSSTHLPSDISNQIRPIDLNTVIVIPENHTLKHVQRVRDYMMYQYPVTRSKDMRHSVACETNPSDIARYTQVFFEGVSDRVDDSDPGIWIRSMDNDNIKILSALLDILSTSIEIQPKFTALEQRYLMSSRFFNLMTGAHLSNQQIRVARNAAQDFMLSINQPQKGEAQSEMNYWLKNMATYLRDILSCASDIENDGAARAILEKYSKGWENLKALAQQKVIDPLEVANKLFVSNSEAEEFQAIIKALAIFKYHQILDQNPSLIPNKITSKFFGTLMSGNLEELEKIESEFSDIRSVHMAKRVADIYLRKRSPDTRYIAIMGASHVQIFREELERLVSQVKGESLNNDRSIV